MENTQTNVQIMNKVANCFETAIEKKYDYVAVAIEIAGSNTPEIIINSTENLKDKMKYYADTYHSNGVHKFSSTVKIIDVDYADYVDELKFFPDKKEN